jgi:oligogalacturonide lyase
VRAIVVGAKTNSVFFTRFDAATKRSSVYKADIDTGEVKKLVVLPARASIASINADETLAVGTRYLTAAGAEQEYGRNLPRPAAGTEKDTTRPGFLVQPVGKALMMERRFAARIPVELFTINLKTGRVKTLLRSRDWIGHLLFSPTDPTLLMYCHEGPWHKLDRIWLIRTDGTHNRLVHKRTMAMEIAGHEFWGLDGKTIWFDWQYPKGEDFFLAGYNLQTGKRTAYHMQRNDWSIHFNLTRDESLFTGDGGDRWQVAHATDGKWIELFHPRMLKADGINRPGFWTPGVFDPERLVNMAGHNYRLEPNVRFSPDRKLIFFTSNMFGASYVFAVEVEKAANPSASEVQSTPELAARFSSRDPVRKEER